MRILVVGDYPPAGQESMRRFALLIAQQMARAGHDVRLLRPNVVFGRIRSGTEGLGKWLGYVDRFLLLPTHLRESANWADVVHICDHSNAPYLAHLQNAPHVVTCHDLIALRSAMGAAVGHRTRPTGRLFQRWIASHLQRGQRIVCVSKKTQEDLVQLVGVPQERTTVVYNGLNYAYSPMAESAAVAHLKQLGLEQGRPFLLHVGGNGWYKNRSGLLRIFSYFSRLPGRHDYRMVLAGRPWTRELRDLAANLEIGDRVSELVDLDNESLRALYTAADALVFPSLYEGFGWPIIEAQACGCPVFATGRPPMTEIGGTAAFYFDPDDEEQAATTIHNLLPRAREVKEQGRRNADRFSLAAMIAGYIREYERVVTDAAGCDTWCQSERHAWRP